MALYIGHPHIQGHIYIVLYVGPYICRVLYVGEGGEEGERREAKGKEGERKREFGRDDKSIAYVERRVENRART